jgi:hypothetical protein
MTAPVALPEAGFAYLRDSGRAFSQGVVALEGFVFHRVQLRQPLSLEAGLKFAAEYLRTACRPTGALCGCELRMPHRLTRPDFRSFNRRYIAELQGNSFVTDPVNPAARTNIAGVSSSALDATLATFTFTVPRHRSGRGRDFLVSGKPEIADAPDRVIAAGDGSSSGAQQKCAFVLKELLYVAQQLGASWHRVSAAQIYTRRSLAEFSGTLASFGLDPSICAHIVGDPPVAGPGDVPLEFEADVRSITIEEIV